MSLTGPLMAPSARPSMPQSSFSRPRKLGLSCLLLLVLLGGAAWLARDTPRRALAAFLSERLQAEVGVEHIEVLTSSHFVLSGLEIAQPEAYPFVERLRIGELEVHGPWRNILDQRFESLLLRNPEAWLAPAPPAPPSDEPMPRVGVLTLEEMPVHVVGQNITSELTVAASFTDLGGDVQGNVRAVSDVLELAPLREVFLPEAPAATGRLRDFDGQWTLGAEGDQLDAGIRLGEIQLDDVDVALNGIRLTAQQVVDGGIRVQLDLEDGQVEKASRVLPLQQARIELSSEPAEHEEHTFDLRAQFPWLDGATARGRLQTVPVGLVELEARFDGLDLGQVVPELGIDDPSATVNFQSQADRLVYEVLTQPRRVKFNDLEVAATSPQKLEAKLSGSLELEPLVTLEALPLEGPLKLDLVADPNAARWREHRLPDALFPLSMSLEGRWRGSESLEFEGRSDLRSELLGRLETDGKVISKADQPVADLDWHWTEGRLENVIALLDAMDWPRPDLNAYGDIEATGSAKGSLEEPSIKARVQLTGVDLQPDTTARSWQVTGARALLTGSLPGGASTIQLQLEDVEGELDVPGLKPLGLQAAARLTTELDASRGRVAEAALRTEGLGNVQLDGEWQLSSQGLDVDANIRISDIELDAWQQAAPEIFADTPASDFTFAGGVTADWRMRSTPRVGWHLGGPVELSNGGFTSSDGSRVMEGLSGRWILDAATRLGDSSQTPSSKDDSLEVPGTPQEVPGTPPQPSIKARLDGELGGFLLLWSTFFGDFTDVTAGLEVSVERHDANSPWQLASQLQVPEGPTLEARIEPLEGGLTQGARYAVMLEEPDLTSTHQRYLSRLLPEQLGQLSTAGSVSAKARGVYRSRAPGSESSWSLLGDVALQDFDLASGGGQAEVSGLRFAVPLEIRQSAGGQLTGPRLPGKLSFERLTIRGLELPPTETDLWVEADSVGLEKPIALAIFGGLLGLESLTLRNLVRSTRHLETGIELAGLDLAEISREMEIFPLEGSLDGRFPTARLSPALLEVDGGGRVELFGGTVDVHGISGENMLSRFPKVAVSADFENIDLGSLTRRIDFGEMNGVLQGSIFPSRALPRRTRSLLGSSRDGRGVRRFPHRRREGGQQPDDPGNRTEQQHF